MCLVGHNESLYDVVCSPVEPGILATCGRKGMVAVWDARSQGGDFSGSLIISLSLSLSLSLSQPFSKLSRGAARRPTVSASLQMGHNWQLEMTSVKFKSGISSKSRSVRKGLIKFSQRRGQSENG